MTTSDQQNNERRAIYAAIAAIIADVGPVGKNSRNEQQRYMYRSADDICDALHEALGKHQVFATCSISDFERWDREAKSGGALQCVRMKCTYTFHAVDGSSVATEAIGEGMDSGDKATNKAMTAAYKYALIQVFALMGHEDSETDSPEVAARQHATNGHAHRVAEQPKRASQVAPPPTSEQWREFQAELKALVAQHRDRWPDDEAVKADIAQHANALGLSTRTLSVDAARADLEAIYTRLLDSVTIAEARPF